MGHGCSNLQIRCECVSHATRSRARLLQRTPVCNYPTLANSDAIFCGARLLQLANVPCSCVARRLPNAYCNIGAARARVSRAAAATVNPCSPVFQHVSEASIFITARGHYHHRSFFFCIVVAPCRLPQMCGDMLALRCCDVAPGMYAKPHSSTIDPKPSYRKATQCAATVRFCATCPRMCMAERLRCV